ncbi:hypothetical protein GE061_015908 [Apolygus lucorum]|uniref:Interferon-related developmental regulator N-terminal domain-containing protein n=1 Tax=Apolygus lucorum TaxID=248454 RepID=A0A8S9XEN1_APOLU|nr:hypothetical protein GE061_015908 [Apolygus lucorum]
MPRRTISTRRRPADPDDEEGSVTDNRHDDVAQRINAVESDVGAIGNQVGELMNNQSVPDTRSNVLAQRINVIESDISLIKVQLDQLLSVLNNRTVQEVHTPPDPMERTESLIEDNRQTIRKKFPKPAKFDGSISWEEYSTQFTIIADANEWSDKERGEHLVASLSGPPLLVVHNLPRQHQSSFCKLSEAFQLRFGSEHLTSLLHSQLQARKQRDSETLAELATDIERLARGAFPDCPPEAVERIAVRSISQLGELLDSAHLDVRMAAGECIALLLEQGRQHNDDWLMEVSDDMLDKLRQLSTDSHKYRAKKDRKTQRSSFRDILRFVEYDELPNIQVRFGQEALSLDSWSKKKQYDTFCQVLGSGMNLHLSENVLLRDILELGEKMSPQRPPLSSLSLQDI